MDKRQGVRALALAPLALQLPIAPAQGAPFKIGLLTPMTGPFASTGKQMEAGARLYMQLNGTTVSGRKIELILKDAVPEVVPFGRSFLPFVENERVVLATPFEVWIR